MDLQQRLAEFFRRLKAAPPAATADEAVALVCRLIEEVEDEYCSVPRTEPPPLTFTGRMYAPREDHMHRQPDGSITASTRRHRIVCQRNGAITVIHMTDKSVVFTKPGRTQ
jgi:hypothetical protein